MARGGGKFTRILQILLDTASAEKAKAESQRILKQATAPDTATRNLNMIGAAFSNMVAAINRRTAALRQAFDEEKRMAAAVREGAEAVNALKVTLAGEHAVQKLNAAAKEDQIAENRRLAEGAERLRQETEQYTASVNAAAIAQRKLDAEMARDTQTVEELRRAEDEQRRMTAATLQGADAVNRLKVTLAGEAAERRLSTNATEAQRAASIRHAQAIERSRQAQDAYNRSLRETGIAGRIWSNLKSFAVGFLGVTTAIFASRKLLEWADTWKLIQGRLKVVTDGAENLNRVTEKLVEIANRTRSSFEATATLFQRISLQAEELGRSEDDLFRLTETLNKAIQLGGANATEARAGVIQFSQALSSGTLRGDEFRSMMENLPGVARALADGLGVPVGKLREMAFAGELTADRVTEALLKISNRVDRDFKNLPVTIGGAFTVLGNSLMEFVGDADEATGATAALARVVVDLAEGIDALRGALGGGGEGGPGVLGTLTNALVKSPVYATLAASFRLNLELLKLRRGIEEAAGRDIKELDRGIVEAERMLRELEARAAAAQRNIEFQPPSGGMGDVRMAESGDLRTAQALRDLPFNEFLGRLESERTAQIVKTKAAHAATAEEVEELNALYEQGNRMLRAGNLSLEQRNRLATALASLGFDELKAKTQAELNRLEDQHIKMLIEARDLGIATDEENKELLARYNAMTAALQRGNLELEDRLRITKNLKDVADSLGLGPITERPAPRPAIPDLLADRRDEEGHLRVRAPALPQLGATREEREHFLDQWRSDHEVMQSVAENAAFGVMDVWQQAFKAIAIEGKGAMGLLEALLRGAAGAAFAGLAQLATSKAAEDIARAFDEKAKAAADTAEAISNPLLAPEKLASAAAHIGAAKSFGFAAAKWALLGGAAGAAGAAASGGGGTRGRGGGGGISTGGRTTAGRAADRMEPKQVVIVRNYVDGIDPDNSIHQTKVGTTVVKYENRRGSRITDGARRRK